MLTPRFKTIRKQKDKNKATFVLEPLEQGFGHTLGNSLRRCLLSTIKGRAVVGVKISGVKHQFSTLEGMKEDVVEFILNVKQLVVKSDSDEAFSLKLNVKGPKSVKAKNIKTPAGVSIINKDLLLAELAGSKDKLDCELFTEVGFSYSLAEDRKSSILGYIPTDAAFSPVVRVSYDIKSARVGRRTDFDSLIMEIETDGSIDPEDALMQAAKTLALYVKQVYDPQEVKEEKKDEPEAEENSEMLELTVEELDLPTRIANALRKGGYPTVRDLVKASKEDISKVKNLGSKSLKIISDKLKLKDVEVFKGEKDKA